MNSFESVMEEIKSEGHNELSILNQVSKLINFHVQYDEVGHACPKTVDIVGMQVTLYV